MTNKHPTTGQKVGYTRVSTVDQSTERQLDGLALDRVFTDKASGKDTQRPALLQCLAYLRDGDTLVVHSMDRLARNAEDLQRIVRELTERGITVEFVKNSLTFRPAQTDPMANLMLAVLAGVAQFEREIIKERQREGIAVAKRTHPEKYRGRAKALSATQAAELRTKAASGAPKAQLARDFKVSRETVYQYLKAQ